jgi:patatin-like phospholipase/acyl hydrolase
MLACSYFYPFEKSGITFADGAVFANNPAEIGEFVGRVVFKSEQR